MAAIRSNALTIRRPRARTMHLRVRPRRRELIPLRAAAIRLRLAPTRRRVAAEAAIAAAAVEVAIAVVGAAVVAAIVAVGALTVAAVVVAVVESHTEAVEVVGAVLPMVAEVLFPTAADTKKSVFYSWPARIFLAGFCIYLLTSSTPAASLPSPASPAPSSAP
jgi:hypothetical protein